MTVTIEEVSREYRRVTRTPGSFVNRVIIHYYQFIHVLLGFPPLAAIL